MPSRMSCSPLAFLITVVVTCLSEEPVDSFRGTLAEEFTTTTRNIQSDSGNDTTTVDTIFITKFAG